MSNVPIWVYVLFFILLYLGIKSCYTRTVSLKRLIILPVIFIYLSLQGTNKLFHFSPTVILLLLIGGCLGFFIGSYYVRSRNVRADKQEHLIEIPGDITMLILVLCIFFIEFFIHYAVESHQSIAGFVAFRFCAVTLSGLITGITIGRNTTYFLKYIRATSVNLSQGE